MGHPHDRHAIIMFLIFFILINTYAFIILESFTDRMLCASSNTLTSPTCHIPIRGDSGGALPMKVSQPEDDVHIGIVSFGYDKLGRKDPVTTDVRYIDNPHDEKNIIMFLILFI